MNRVKVPYSYEWLNEIMVTVRGITSPIHHMGGRGGAAQAITLPTQPQREAQGITSPTQPQGEEGARTTHLGGGTGLGSLDHIYLYIIFFHFYDPRIIIKITYFD